MEVVLVIDIGNTNVVLGLYKEGKLLQTFRELTERCYQEISLHSFFRKSMEACGLMANQISRVSLASVVLPLIPLFQGHIRKLTGKNCLVVNSDNIGGLPVDVPKPDAVGIDRLINAYSAYTQFQHALVVIDLGTATTFDVVSSEGTFVGGAISPGLRLSHDALVACTDQLPSVEMAPPPSVIGKNTIECMQSGIIFGYAGMLDSMIARISDEMEQKLLVIATGGLAPLMKPVASCIDYIQSDLTLKGLYLLAQG